MLAATSYFVVNYDNEASGPFVAESTTLITWPGGGSGYVVTVIDNGSTGKLVVGLYTSDIPDDGEQLTQGSTTADADGDAELLLYPAFFRPDVAVAADGDITWTGKNLGVTHSFRFDGQSTNCSVGDIITFVDGQQCELVQVISDAGASGEYGVRWITPIDLYGYPEDDDTFTSDGGGDGTLDGLVHDRAYSPLHMHRLLQDLADDEQHASDDVLAIYKPKPSSRSTDQIVTLLGTMNITDTVAQHMYGGSITQGAGATQKLYSGVAVQVTDADGESNPVLIQNEAIITAYWENAFMPDSIVGKVRLLVPTREDGCDIDGKRIMGRLLEFQNFYFTASTTLGTAETALALFAGTDGNNQTAVGTVAGAPYNTIVITQGYQTIDYSNGNGATPYALKFDLGSATKAQAYERWKYIQRRGTSETLFNRNAQLVLGITMDFAYDGDFGTFNEGSSAEVLAWGFEIPYTSLSGGTFTIGNVLIGGSSGARGRIIYDDGVDFAVVVLEGTTAFSNTESLTEYSNGTATGVTATSGTVVNNATAGTAVICADDTSGNNIYLQRLTGVDPADGQTCFGRATEAYCDVNGSVNSYVNNNQFVGVFTGADFQTNRGIGLDPTDAGSGDLLLNLLGVQQQPPNNQQGVATGLSAGVYIAMYPWDGSSVDSNGDAQPNFDEMSANTGITQGNPGPVDVGTGNIPNNTPSSGYLRIERDSDGEYFLWQYSSHDGDDEFTMVGNCPFTFTAGNDVMRALVDREATGSSESFTAPYTAPPMQVVIIARHGGASPIQPVTQTATFGATGFSSGVNQVSDA